MKRITFLALVLGCQWTSPAAQDRFVAHEWGTFTSVQGADGVQLEWNPFAPLALPKFVYGQERTGIKKFLGKGELIARQRMETPVIYFYSDTERKVDVTVKFPGGVVTEWYPQAERTGIMTRWKDVRVLAKTAAPLPEDARGSHYYAARDTSANVLEATAEHEKFLFYRGVASFTAPLRILVGGPNEDVLHLHNSGSEALRHFYVVQIYNGMAKYTYFDRLQTGEARQVKLESDTGQNLLTDFQNHISNAMAASLEKEGLYAAEATAMVNTWRDSWFGEDGVRVLYVLPRVWTDRTLPLSIEPAPQEIARVMVGRAEVIFPSQEWRFLRQIVRYSEATPEQRSVIAEDAKALGMGRFADAAVRRLLGSTPSSEFKSAAFALIEATNLRGTAKNLAAR